MSEKVEIAAVLGGGSFGTAMATILAENGHQTRLWVRDPETAAVINASHENPRYLPGAELPAAVVATESLQEALNDATLIFVAVPSKAYADVLLQAKEWVAPGTIVVSCTKGIHADGFQLMSDLLKEHWPQTSVGVLSGPNLAKEVVERVFTGTVIASEDHALCERIQNALGCGYFRVYDNSDMYGVELAGALKNIYAIATGMAAALGVGENSRAFLITRSLAEMSRFAVQLGANPMTFLGLAGVGDLIVTCSSSLSRNYRVGYMLGQGKTMDEAVAELGQTAEGINTIKLVAAEAKRRDVYMPIATGLNAMLFAGLPVQQVIAGLMQGEHNHDVEFMVTNREAD
ncbi:MAG: NAD(P)H-dependent glycerol-3-phosphate dehydrogenase [Alcanivoracaceae bacterium]|nr:NAD(P)H-dependent glycerol-3-phosphate dehydrogenase [Alcanivoracaceae bacterium]